jgi:preprotein translocase subunit YajC
VDRIKKLNLGLIVALVIALVPLAGCTAQTGEGGAGSSFSFFIILLILMFGLMYVFTIRPQRRKQKEHNELIAALKKGDKVITVGGVYGQIESINEENVVLKIESGAAIRVSRSSVTIKRSA